jgi:hypothetical protein
MVPKPQLLDTHKKYKRILKRELLELKTTKRPGFQTGQN